MIFFKKSDVKENEMGSLNSMIPATVKRFNVVVDLNPEAFLADPKISRISLDVNKTGDENVSVFTHESVFDIFHSR